MEELNMLTRPNLKGKIRKIITKTQMKLLMTAN